MIQHNPNDHRIEDIDDAAEKLRIKKEKNAASAKKTRDRKKAYVNELEQRLQKQEAKIAKLIQSEIKLLLNHVELYKDQPERIQLLKEETIKKEDLITNKVAALKKNLSETFAGKDFTNKGDNEAMSNYQNTMFQQIGKLYTMQNYLAEPDKLRALTFNDIQQILLTKQKAFAIFTIHQHIKRLQSWNNLCETTCIV
ncbi:transcription factor TGA2.1-like isoform X1 [Rutidosis leptorrhynchoides]|uniref:transcription factor TGA2.1-like isoform X1 n=1 Tax=Rutidosis leptorrhynchoides TaxID=125765 RepID=UPI003A9A20E9